MPEDLYDAKRQVFVDPQAVEYWLEGGTTGRAHTEFERLRKENAQLRAEVQTLNQVIDKQEKQIGWTQPKTEFQRALDIEMTDFEEFAKAKLNQTVPNEVRTTDPDTGAMKGRKDIELFTAPPQGLEEYGRVCAYGSNGKYAPNNWRLGFDWSLSANALLRHYLKWVGGEDKDQESNLHHLAHAAWHCLVLVQYASEHPEKDDRFGGPNCPATKGGE